jgi:hypothetical protein
MKNLPGIVKVSVLTAIAVMVFFTIQACAPFMVKLEHATFALIITFPQQVTSKEKFKKALSNLSPKASYHFHFVPEQGPSEDFDHQPKMTIKTDRVIKTELATSLSKDEFTAIGSNITHHLYSPDATDVGKILNELKK